MIGENWAGNLLVSRTLKAETFNPNVKAVVLFPPNSYDELPWNGILRYGVIKTTGRLKRELSHYKGVWFDRVTIPEAKVEKMPHYVRHDFAEGKVIYRKEGYEGTWPPSEADSTARTEKAKYSQAVKYMGFRKCQRILDDANKMLSRGKEIEAGYLQFLALFYISQMDYIIQNRTTPPTLYLGYNGVTEDQPVRNLVSRFNYANDIEKRQKALQGFANERYAFMNEKHFANGFWESPPLRFSRKFKFDDLLFRESHHLLWKFKDKFLPLKGNLTPLFRSLEKRGKFQTLSEMLNVLSVEARNFPEIKALLWIGSSAGGNIPLEEMQGKDVDLVFFFGGSYFKRAFIEMQGVQFDILGVPFWLASVGFKMKDPLTMECLTTGKILLDNDSKLERMAEKASKFWMEGPSRFPEKNKIHKFADMELEMAETRFLVESDHPNWSLGAAELVDQLIRFTLAEKQVWLPGAQQRPEALKKVDPLGHNFLRNIIKSSDPQNTIQSLESWMAHIKSNHLGCLPQAVVIEKKHEAV